jgi:hypothetical protein
VIAERVAGVDHEIEQHLRELGGIDADVERFFAQFQHEFASAPDEPAEDGGVVADEGIKIDDRRMERLPAAEDEELLRQRSALAAGGVDGVDLIEPGGVAGEFGREDFAVAVDDGEEVIEIVGYAAGEAPDGVEALSVDESFLKAAFFRGVAVNSDDVR